jgi:hypothetical protein
MTMSEASSIPPSIKRRLSEGVHSFEARLTSLITASPASTATDASSKKIKTDKPAKKQRDPNAPKKPKMSKTNPLNLNLQCAVPIEGGSCSRSLTCKTHSLTAKRAVQGRTAPFDQLLQEWNTKHNPDGAATQKLLKQQQQQQPEKKPKKVKVKVVEPQIYGEISDSDNGSDDAGSDSEEECDQVVTGIKHALSCPRPFPGLDADGSFLAVRNTRISRWRNSLAGALLEDQKRGI